MRSWGRWLEKEAQSRAREADFFGLGSAGQESGHTTGDKMILSNAFSRIPLTCLEPRTNA